MEIDLIYLMVVNKSHFWKFTKKNYWFSLPKDMARYSLFPLAGSNLLTIFMA